MKKEIKIALLLIILGLVIIVAGLSFGYWVSADEFDEQLYRFELPQIVSLGSYLGSTVILAGFTLFAYAYWKSK